MSPPSSDGRKPALSAALRNLAIGLDAYRVLIEADGLYATDAGYQYAQDLEDSCGRLVAAAHEAIDRQLEQRAR